jgi:hypothetical protein
MPRGGALRSSQIGFGAPTYEADAADQRGPTSSHNMGCLCKRHHQLKTLHGWTLTRQTDGTLRWTSPSGRTYDVPPQNHWPHGC